MTRRGFLWASAGSIGLAASIQGRPIRAGFLGGAHSHAESKWRLVGESSEFERVGMTEPSDSLRQRFQALGAVFLSEAELLARSDVIFVESAVGDHARHAMLALSAGRHVHVEKPVGTRLSEIQEMARLAQRHDLVFQSGYMWRHHPGFDAVFQAVRSGWLGRVHLVRGMIGNALESSRRPEWGQFEGGGLFELGSHLIDALIRLMGEPDRVTPFLRRDGGYNDRLQDNNAAVFEFKQAMGIILNSTLDPGAGPRREFEVIGSNGTATLRPIEKPVLQIDLAQAAGPYRAGAQQIPLPRYERYRDDIRELAACIRGERKPRVSLDEEIRVQRWLLKACGVDA
jgi:hypothetical protein